MTTYYNDNDRHVAAWLKELIKAGMISAGDVDDRSIKDVKGSDLKGYTRVHFFAGIGGWDYALTLAGWPTDRYVWTGSCPCQPLSGAGQRKGERDERHLWPEFHRLIKECRPSTIFGEQVASTDGREWFAGVRADLEALDYAVGGADLCAAGEFAPHIRQRLYWVADCQSVYRRLSVRGREPRQEADEFIGSSQTIGLADSEIAKRGRASGTHDGGRRLEEAGRYGITSGLADSDMSNEHRRPPIGEQPVYNELQERGSGLGDSERSGLPGEYRRRAGQESKDGCEPCGMGDTSINRGATGFSGPDTRHEGNTGKPINAGGQGYWTNSILIPCGDGKARRIEPGISPLVDGLPGRVGLLRGYGNAIVPQVAAKFVQAYLSTK